MRAAPCHRRRLPRVRAGSRQLFLGDVQSGIKKFAALFGFFANEVVLSPNRQHLDELPLTARENVLSVVAAYIPYYNPPGVRCCGAVRARSRQAWRM